MTELNVKLAAIINKEADIGVAMNALAHMSLGLGGQLGVETSQLDDYQDVEGNTYPNISRIPFIILRGKSSEIRKTIFAAKEAGLNYGAFTETMREGTYIDQLERTRNTKLEDHKFIGCVLFGPKEKVTELTRKFSLWK
jgi:hypothetical protein